MYKNVRQLPGVHVERDGPFWKRQIFHIGGWVKVGDTLGMCCVQNKRAIVCPCSPNKIFAICKILV